VSLIKTGKLRALCVSVLQRDESLPDVPTCDELGYKGFDVATMLGLQAAAGTPAPIVAKLQGAVAKILRGPEIAAAQGDRHPRGRERQRGLREVHAGRSRSLHQDRRREPSANNEVRQATRFKHSLFI
jgi:hypothetical protein